MARGDLLGGPGRRSTFFSIGPEEGALRIYDAGSGLAAADVTIVSCRWVSETSLHDDTES